ncbi:hypothetical protein [uncultured Draconibacterium sp.]|uniref:hypothetical protein n=1 Tax=uncultured Draconibacterium sp. TaxID=1573823 RepID=UPI003261AF9A
MKMIEWNTLKLDLKKLFNFQGEKDYLSKLVANFEELEQKGKNIPFKITGLRRKGFIIKAAGLFGFISFDHMPWKYENHNAWNAVFPSIKGKIFFGKTHQFQKKPLSLILNGEIPQFKKIELNETDKYKGIIINKTKYGLFIDFGYHFNWDCGSIVGMVHKSNFAPIETFEKLEIGETTEVFFLGSNNKEQLLFGDNNVSKEWLNGEVEKLVGEILPVKIIKTNDDKTDYLVNEKYNATLPTINSIYPTNKKIIKSAIKNFKNGDLIHCEILKVNKLNKTLQLKWDFAHEIEGIISRMTIEESKPKNQIKEFRNRSNSVENIADTNVIEKLNLIGKTVKVEVIKKEDNLGRISNKYKIENKYSGKLILSNDNYKISTKEKKRIEKNLQDGEILDCQVLSVDKNQISINWKLMDEELLRFIKV